MKRCRICSLVVITWLFTVSLINPGCSHPIAKFPKARDTVRFVVLADSRGTDTGINSVVIRKTLSAIKGLSSQPEFAIIPGDLVNGSKDKNLFREQLVYFKKIITEYYPISFFYMGLGNHEVVCDDGEKIFKEFFGGKKVTFLKRYNETVYCMDLGHTLLFMLNTDHPDEIHTVSEKQLSWVQRHIDRSKKHTIFFMHEPSYPTGYHIGGSQDSDPYRRNELWNLIDTVNGPMVFCGHEHFYSRRHIDKFYNEIVKGKKYSYEKSVFQVTIGGFGGPLTDHFDNKTGVDIPPIGHYHFAVVDAAPDSVRVTVFNPEGEILDRFSD
jgi:hypothetical protein